jgi:HK97 family phage portal protein
MPFSLQSLGFSLKNFTHVFPHLSPKQAEKNANTHKKETFTACQVLGSPVWTPRHYESLARTGYSENVIVFRCVSLIAKSLSSVHWLLYQKTPEGETEIEHHPLLDLLNHPNAEQAGSAFLETLFSQYLLAGNVYIEALGKGDSEKRPERLQLLRSDRVHVLIDDEGNKIGYEWKNGSHQRFFPADKETGASALLHVKTFHPLNDWYGMSPIEAAARSIDQHNAVGEHNLSILQNGGRPSGALLIRPSSTGTVMNHEQREELRQDLRNFYEGAENAGRIMVVEGNCEWKEMGKSPKDLDFKSGKNMSAREIAQAFGVPPILIGLTEDATFSNYKEARLTLWEETLLPLLDHFVSALNHWLVPLFDPSLRLRYDPDKFPALASKRDHIWTVLNEADFLTLNEKRQALGYGPLPAGDKLA